MTQKFLEPIVVCYEFKSNANDAVRYKKIKAEYRTLKQNKSELVAKASFIYFSIGKCELNSGKPLELLAIDSGSKKMQSIYNTFDSGVSSKNVRLISFIESIEALGAHAGGVSSLDLLYVDRIEVLEKFRGADLSKFILEHAAENISSRANVIGLVVEPLQFEQDSFSSDELNWNDCMAMDSFTRDTSLAKNRLSRHYRRLGFTQLQSGVFVKFIPKSFF